MILPAFNEGDHIAETVDAARAIPGVGSVIVVDDGSTDGTAIAAAGAGALVLRHERNRGKAAAMTTGAAHVPDPTALLLFLDADLRETASEARKLIEPVRSGDADMAIANFIPRAGVRGGGGGFVVRLARWGIRTCAGRAMNEPLSGQRCVRRGVFDAALPLAAGFGVETALTIDVLRAGYSVCEIPLAMTHRVTGTDWRARWHRARQWRDVARALLPRLMRGGNRP